MTEDYIPREAALKAIHTSTAPALEVKHIPAADVRPVVRGRWDAVKSALHPAETSAVCSNCGFATMIHAQTFYHFCPNCGAKMDGGQDNASNS